MLSSNGRDLSVALVHGGEVLHTVAVPHRLVRQLCRASQFAGVRHGFLPPDAPCRAWVGPVANPTARRPKGAGPHLAPGLHVVVRAEGATFARELPVDALQPWVQRVATAYANGVGEPAGTRYGFVLLTARRAPVETSPGLDLHPFTLHWGRRWPAAQYVPTHPGVDGDDYVPFAMPAREFEMALHYCRQQTDNERAGVILGYLAADSAGRFFVDARHFCRALHTDATALDLRFTRATWAAIQAERASLGRDLQTVGWLHSHVRCGLGTDARADLRFLSARDVAIAEAHFDPPHAATIVVDAERHGELSETTVVYGWDSAGVGLIPRSIDIY